MTRSHTSVRHFDPETAKITFKTGSIVIPQAGLVGFTDPMTGDVDMTIDPDSAVGMKDVFTKWLPAQLAHELHHSKRIKNGPGYGATLREALVSEGLADAYAFEAYPKLKTPWTDALTDEQEGAAWEKAQPELDGNYPFAAHTRWFFGARDIPYWAGYTMGFRISQAYLKEHPETTAAKAFDVNAKDVLAR